MKQYNSLFEKYNFILKKKNSITDCVNLNEAALSPIYYENIEKYIKSLEKEIKKKKFVSLSTLCLWLSFKFRKYAIRFVVDNDSEEQGNNEYSVGITKSGCLSNSKGTIKIYCNENLLKLTTPGNFFNYFTINVIRIIGHELIHRNQMFHLTNKKLRNYIFDHSKLEVEEYLKNKQEMMSRAWQIIEEFRYKELNDKTILNIMRNNKDTRIIAKSFTLSTYFDYFNPKDKIFKDLYKYMYLYISNQDVE